MASYPLEQIDLARERHEASAFNAPWNLPDESVADYEARVLDAMHKQFAGADVETLFDALADHTQTADVLLYMIQTGNLQGAGLVVHTALLDYCRKIAEKNA